MGLGSLRSQVGLMAVAFASGVLIARIAGTGWGTATGFGQMAFAATLVAILLRSPS